MKTLKEQIIRVLSNGDTTRDNLLFQLSGGISDRQMRKFISEEMPEVGSSHKRGYFLIKNENDLDDSIRDLKSKAKSIYRRADSQYKRFGKEFQPQLLFKC